MIEPMIQTFNCSRCSRNINPDHPHATPHTAEPCYTDQKFWYQAWICLICKNRFRFMVPLTLAVGDRVIYKMWNAEENTSYEITGIITQFLNNQPVVLFDKENKEFICQRDQIRKLK